MNLTFADRVYLSDDRMDKELIRRQILEGVPGRGLHVLVLHKDGDDLMDIIPAKEIVKSFYQDKDFTIVGLAKGYHRAVRLSEQIIGDLYAAYKDFNIHAYFGC